MLWSVLLYSYSNTATQVHSSGIDEVTEIIQEMTGLPADHWRAAALVHADKPSRAGDRAGETR
jgi:hypothetical protein